MSSHAGGAGTTTSTGLADLKLPDWLVNGSRGIKPPLVFPGSKPPDWLVNDSRGMKPPHVILGGKSPDWIVNGQNFRRSASGSTTNSSDVKPPSGEANGDSKSWFQKLPRSSKDEEDGHKHSFEVKYFKKSFKCDGCQQESNGSRYRCVSCNEEFHHDCRNFSMFKTVHEDGHKHEYELRSYNKMFQCDGCKEEGFGNRFWCDGCHSELHTRCRFPKETFTFEWHGNHTFEFCKKVESSPSDSPDTNVGRWCNACGQDIHGHFYHCEEKKWNLHPCCMYLPSMLSADNQVFDLKERDSLKCFWCKLSNRKSKKSTRAGWSYVSGDHKVQHHVRCIREMMHNSCLDSDGSNVSKILEDVKSKAVATGSSSGGGIGGKVWKIFVVILKMIVSTVLGDPTIGLVHVFGGIFLN